MIALVAVNTSPSDSAQTQPTGQKIRLWAMLVILLLLSPFAFSNLRAIVKVIWARHAVSGIERLGGKVSLSEKTADLMLDPTAADESAVLGWHRSAFGDTSALLISFSGLPITDADVDWVNGFQKVYGLNLDKTPITDAGLDLIKGRTEIRYLSLQGTAVTDTGLKRLEGLTLLRKLDLTGTKITDAGLKYFSGFDMLTELKLSNTRITDAGLSYIEKIPHLQLIELDGTAVSESERDRLKKLCADRIPPDDD